MSGYPRPSDVIAYRYLNDENQEVDALLAREVIENLVVVVRRRDLSYDERVRIQSHVREVVGEALTSYEPPASADGAGAFRQSADVARRSSVSIAELPLPDAVREHVERHVQQEVERLLPSRDGGGGDGPDGIDGDGGGGVGVTDVTCVAPLAPVAPTTEIMQLAPSVVDKITALRNPPPGGPFPPQSRLYATSTQRASNQQERGRYLQ